MTSSLELRDDRDDEEPDPRLLWGWVAKASRPYAGWIFIGAGAFLILLGYFGVSRESIVGKQIPYLVSGGIGGILLAVIGAYFLGTEELRKDSGRLDRLERQVSELHAALLSRPDAPAPPPAVSSNGLVAPSTVVAVDAGETFHRADCALANGKAVEDLTPGEAAGRGLRPCPVCEPTAAAAH